MKKILIVLTLMMLLPTPLLAVPTTYFGEDLSSAPETPVPPNSRPNSDAARNTFFSKLSGDVGTENFEAFTPMTPTPLTVSFQNAGTATLSGGQIVDDANPLIAGTYSISPDKYWVGNNGFTLIFSSLISAFGFYATDVGDFGGQLSLTFQNGDTEIFSLPHTIGSAGSTGGSVLYFGIIDTANPFTSVTFNNSFVEADAFGFDDFTIATASQVIEATPVPLPPTVLLMGSGLVGLLGLRRRFMT